MSDTDARRGPQKGRTLTPADLESVAYVYHEAVATGQPVNQAVADAFGLSKDGAGKRIRRARRAGLLEDVDEVRRSNAVAYGDDVTITVAVSRDMLEWLDKVKRSGGWNRSQVVRGIITNEMRRAPV